MRSLIELYVQQFKTTMATMFAYRASLLIWMASRAGTLGGYACPRCVSCSYPFRAYLRYGEGNALGAL